MLQAIQIAKRFGARDLFVGLSWQLQRGDRVGIVGPNGAGKTTLLRILAGVEPCDEGQISCERGASVGYLPQEAPRVASGSILQRVMDADVQTCALLRELHDVEAHLEQQPADALQWTTRHAEISDALQLRDGHTLQGRAQDVLVGLGFAAASLSRPVTELSGGWWMRVELARLLLLAPDYLLLDEPTNHLDLQSLSWLEDFLARYPGAWAVVSHDRHFLNHTVDRIAELSSDGLFNFVGDYDAYREARQALSERLAAEAAHHGKRVQQITAFIDRWQASAARSKQATSRVKMLERLGSAAPAARRQKTLRFALPAAPRSSKRVIALSGIDKSYGDKRIYRGLDLLLEAGERLALVGDNGAGKSTLLKILAGVESADAGGREVGVNTQIYYFAQHALDGLDARRSVLEEMRATMPDATVAQLRGTLGAFLFSGDKVECRVGVLSGGEKSRLALAKMLAKPANLLLLDEPTNHLDLQSRDIIEAALADFDGSIVFISHDRYFLNRLATQVMHIDGTGRGTVSLGNYQEFLRRQAAAVAVSPAAPAAAAAAAPPSQPPAAASREARRAQARAVARRQKNLAALEAAIEATEAALGRLDAELCDPMVYADAPRCKELMAQRQSLQDTLQEHYAAWEAAEQTTEESA